MTDFTLAIGVTNKVWDNQYYLVLDYDWIPLETVEQEIIELQKSFSLSDASLYNTKNGVHVYFFNDNELKWKEIDLILKATKHLDPKFIESWEWFYKKREGVTLRTSGKYEWNDVFFLKNIPGQRLPTLIQKSIATSLENMIADCIVRPLLPSFVLRPVEWSGADPEWLSTPDNLSVVSNEKSYRPQAIHKMSYALQWYKSKQSDSIARCIFSLADSRELALTIPHEFRTADKDQAFFDIRPFFLKNLEWRDAMMQIWNGIDESIGFFNKPYNFFQSHAKYHTEDIEAYSPKSTAKRREYSEYLKDPKHIKSFDIIFDIDSKNADTVEAYENARKMHELLSQMGLPFSVNFSWSKWFHFRIDGDIINSAIPEFVEYLRWWNEKVVHVFKNLWYFAQQNDINIDTMAYSGWLRSIIRTPWTVHWATGSVVKPLSDREFESLAWKTLRQIQEIYRVDNVLQGNTELGASRVNFQKKDFIMRVNVGDGRFMSWEEMANSHEFDEQIEYEGAMVPKWKYIRSTVINPSMKDLREIEKININEFISILHKGEYDGNRLYDIEYIDLSNGWNSDFTRPGDQKKLREFISSLMS